MSRSMPVRILLALFVLAFAASPVLAANESRFTASLKGANERPTPIETNAAGEATFTISEDETSITFRLIVANINDVTQAHIHCGGPDVAGPVVVFLFGFDPVGVTVNGILSQGTITADDVIARPDSALCPGGVANLADVIEKIRSGEAYANVHTILNAPGEIRGTIR
jgi:hypothetical protein